MFETLQHPVECEFRALPKFEQRVEPEFPAFRCFELQRVALADLGRQ
jgi:hypothetical protein